MTDALVWSMGVTLTVFLLAAIAGQLRRSPAYSFDASGRLGALPGQLAWLLGQEDGTVIVVSLDPPNEIPFLQIKRVDGTDGPRLRLDFPEATWSSPHLADLHALTARFGLESEIIDLPEGPGDVVSFRFVELPSSSVAAQFFLELSEQLADVDGESAVGYSYLYPPPE